MLDIKKLLIKILQHLNSLGTAAFKSVANNLTTASAGTAVLDAYQGKVLKDSIPTGAAASKNVANNLTTSSAGSYVLDAYQGKVLNDKFGDYATTSSLSNYVKTSAIGAAASKSVANNLTTSSAGSAVLDAYQGYVLNNKLTVETQEFAAASYSKLSGSCYAHRVGKVGILFISTLTGLTANATTDLFTISAKYRPTTAVTQDCLVAGGTPSCVRITINTNGLVQVYNYSTSTDTRNIRANIAYVCAG